MIDTTVTVSTLTFEDMCFRITDLEAKLAKVAGSLEDMCAEFRGYDLPYGSKAYTKATATLAELKGQNDE